MIEEKWFILLLPLYFILFPPPAFVREQITPTISITALDWDNKSCTDKLGERSTRLLKSVLSSFTSRFIYSNRLLFSATEVPNKPSRSKHRLAAGNAAMSKWYVQAHDNYCDNMRPLFFFHWRVLRTRQIGRAIERG